MFKYLFLTRIAEAEETTIETVLTKSRNIILASVIPFLFTAATAVFVIGVFKYIASGKAGDSKKNEEARSLIIWSVAGLTVVIVMWGLARVIKQSLGFPEDGIPTPDDIP